MGFTKTQHKSVQQMILIETQKSFLDLKFSSVNCF